jgi:DNA invertase Pin-like site-specific DNA recombinase
LLEFASKQSWIVVAEYVDTVSGSGKKERPQFRRMMLGASQRQFDLFWKLDRLSREGTRKALVYLTQFDPWNVAWRSFMEPYFDSCADYEGLSPCNHGNPSRTGTDQHF